MTKKSDEADGTRNEGRRALATLRCGLLYAVFLGLGVGCAMPKGHCQEGEECPNGSHCITKDSVGVCVWGKLGPNGATVPDIRFQLVHGRLSARKRTSDSALEIQIEVYGASGGIDGGLLKEGEGGSGSFPCEEVGFYANGERRQLRCLPQTHYTGEGDYQLEVNAHGAEGNATEAFSWTYDITPPEIHIEVGAQGKWGRDEVLYVQLQSVDEDIDWEQTELSAGDYRAALAACPRNLPQKTNARCFEVSLSKLPSLPHGEYELNLSARPADEAGNQGQLEHQELIRISRELWTLPFHALPDGVTTREGNLLLLAPPWNGADEHFLLALNAKKEEIWRTTLLPDADGDFLLGNHRGDLDVVLTSCHHTLTERDGFYVFNAKTGAALSNGCTNLQPGYSTWALLQGGPGKDLVVARAVALETTPESYVLQACRLNTSAFGSNNPAFDCEALPLPPEMPPTNSKFLWQNLLVRQTPEGALVFLGSLTRHWCAFRWADKGRNNNGWSSGCVLQGPAASPVLTVAQPILLGSKYLWGEFHDSNDDWKQAFPLDGGQGEAVDVGDLLLVDSNDELLAAAGVPGRARRYSAQGGRLSTSERALGYITPYGSALMGKGEIVFSEAEQVACLKSDLSDCWQTVKGAYADGADLLGVLPLSPTRSVVVLNYTDSIAAFLFDAPSLKKDAPWPISGHDMCRSYNASVPVDNCWDGPKP
ncbi:MAG: hypothetical protein FWD46_08335 [Cystobacterineae bacterium]|nr:hypothetical protein [Cystobacterineae bacterium]